MSKRGVIVSGGQIDDTFALQMLAEVEPHHIIGVDRGLQFLYSNQVMPTHIVGDFDSVPKHVIEYYKTETEIPIQEFPSEKDATDTEIAVRLAVELGVSQLWILGATGTRLDHVMSNIQVLKIAHDNHVKAWIVDSCNRISLAKHEVRLIRNESFGEYFSLFPFEGVVEDLSIEGAKYPLSHYRMSASESRCVSNEYQEDEVKITFPDGMIILMETRDKN